MRTISNDYAELNSVLIPLINMCSFENLKLTEAKLDRLSEYLRD